MYSSAAQRFSMETQPEQQQQQFQSLFQQYDRRKEDICFYVTLIAIVFAYILFFNPEILFPESYNEDVNNDLINKTFVIKNITIFNKN